MKLSRLIFAAIVIAGVALCVWKAQFGFDLYDEPFYLTPGFKLFALGDKPFANHVLNGPRFHDVLNYYLASPLLPFDILTLRWAALGLYATLLLALTIVAFGKRVGIVAGLSFLALLCFDLHLKATWSHNCWARNFLILHHTLLLLSLKKKAARNAAVFAAGLCLGGAVIAYNTLVIAPVGAILFLAILRRRRNQKENERVSLGLYAAGCLAVVAGVGAWLFQAGLVADWIFALKATGSQSEYAANATFLKLFGLLAYVVTRPELWAFIACAIAVRWPILMLPMGGLTVCLFAIRFLMKAGNLDNLALWALSAFVGVTVAGALALGNRALRLRDEKASLLVVITLLSAFAMGMSSEGASGSLYWAVPALFIPFIAWLHQNTRGLARPVLPLTLALLCAAVILHQKDRAYGDVSPAEMSARVDVAPLKGIYTTPRRAVLFNRIAELVDGKEFVLAYGRMPVTFLFGKARSSVDTTFVDIHYPPQMHQALLNRMLEKNRLPELVFWQKVNGWTWAKGAPVWIIYPGDYPYFALTRCASDGVLERFEEFEAFAVSPTRYRECMSKERLIALK